MNKSKIIGLALVAILVTGNVFFAARYLIAKKDAAKYEVLYTDEKLSGEILEISVADLLQDAKLRRDTLTVSKIKIILGDKYTESAVEEIPATESIPDSTDSL